MIQPRLCKQIDFEQEWFKNYAKELKEDFRYHRKLWEFVVMVDTLHSFDVLKEGSKGLGFAVGTEPLSSYFIKQGCEITASDLILENSKWRSTNEVALNIENLNENKIINNDLLKQKCKFLNVDMNNIPEELRQEQYDFIWSSCAFEHLGSLEQGLDFVINSLDCLKSGGIAVHTTEFNCDSNEDTIMFGDSNIFRQCDMEDLEEQVKDIAKFYSIDYDQGDMEYDLHIDQPPYPQNIHLKLNLFNYTSTSLLIIIEKGK